MKMLRDFSGNAEFGACAQEWCQQTLTGVFPDEGCVAAPWCQDETNQTPGAQGKESKALFHLTFPGKVVQNARWELPWRC